MSAPPPRVLVVDAQPLDEEHLGSLLVGDGFQVERAPSALHALNLLQGAPFDIVVLGGTTAGQSIPRMISMIRAAHPAGTLPLVAVCPGGDTRPMIEALESGASEVLAFSDGYAMALARLRHLVRRHRRPRDLVDPDTGLATPELLLDHLNRTLAAARRDDSLSAVLLVAIEPPDAVPTIEISRAISSGLRSNDLAARLRDGNYGVLLEDVQAPKNALRVGRRIESALRGLGLRVRVGIAAALTNLDNATAVLAAAKAAIARDGPSLALHDKAMHHSAVSQLHLEADLVEAVQSGRLEVHYQPIVHLSTRRLAGFEALARWPHPERGWVGPDLFIQMGEDQGLIAEIGRQMLHDACSQMAAWHREHPHLRLSVNVSPYQLRDSKLADHVIDAVDGSSMASDALRLELTESTIMDDFDVACATFDRLSPLGIRLAVDDFGTGYSSLTWLHRLPVAVIKIDRSFTERMPVDSDEPCMVDTITGIAHGMGMSVIAEGVERAAQLARLESIGCDYAQGYHFAPPVDAEAATRLLASSGGGW